MNWLLRFLPEDKRALLELALRITSSLDSAKERRDAARYGLDMLSKDSEGGALITITEWAVLGRMLGVFKPSAKS